MNLLSKQRFYCVLKQEPLSRYFCYMSWNASMAGKFRVEIRHCHDNVVVLTILLTRVDKQCEHVYRPAFPWIFYEWGYSIGDRFIPASDSASMESYLQRRHESWSYLQNTNRLWNSLLINLPAGLSLWEYSLCWEREGWTELILYTIACGGAAAPLSASAAQRRIHLRPLWA